MRHHAVVLVVALAAGDDCQSPVAECSFGGCGGGQKIVCATPDAPDKEEDTP